MISLYKIISYISYCIIALKNHEKCVKILKSLGIYKNIFYILKII